MLLIIKHCLLAIIFRSVSNLSRNHQVLSDGQMQDSKRSKEWTNSSTTRLYLYCKTASAQTETGPSVVSVSTSAQVLLYLTNTYPEFIPR